MDTFYLVDDHDFITFVDENWVEFGRANGLRSTTGVIGTSIWSHITDITTRYFYKLFMSRVRSDKAVISLPFRCDSPDHRRFMELRMTRRLDLQVEFKALLLREESRAPVGLLDPSHPRNDQFLRMCSWCKKVDSDGWVEPEIAVRKLDIFARPALPMISHVTCPACETKMRSDFGLAS